MVPESFRDSLIAGWHVITAHVKIVMDRRPAFLRVLYGMDVENSIGRSVEAGDLLAQMDLSFLCNLTIFRVIHGEIKFLSDMFQAPSLDLARTVDLIQALQIPICSKMQYRRESGFR